MSNIQDDNANSNNKADVSNPNPSSNNTPNPDDNASPAQPAQPAPANAFSTPDFDASEITRKLDGIIETQSVLTKALSQLMQNGTKPPSPDNATSTTRPSGDPSATPPKTIDQLSL